MELALLLADNKADHDSTLMAAMMRRESGEEVLTQAIDPVLPDDLTCALEDVILSDALAAAEQSEIGMVEEWADEGRRGMEGHMWGCVAGCRVRLSTSVMRHATTVSLDCTHSACA